MAGIIRLSNTGTGNGQSTITTAASGDVTYTLPSGGGTFVTTTSTQALTVPFASGTVSAPSITFLGDSNTGIYSPAADTIAFTEGGVESLRIDSSGRVGLGTSIPGTLLDVVGGVARVRTGGKAGSNTYLLLESTDASNTMALSVANSTNASWQIQAVENGVSYRSLVLNPAGGNVGVGTTSPATILHTNVGSGNNEIRQSVGNVTTAQFISNTSDQYIVNLGNGGQTFWNGGSERARITQSGQLLVGTTTATANGGVLQVSNGITFPATQSACSDANTLDDYEEGTWTPTVGGTATYTKNTGNYTKLGRLVSVSFELAINTIGTGSQWQIFGLPFTATSTGSHSQGGSVGYVNGLATNIVSTFLRADAGDTYLVLASLTAAGTFSANNNILGNGSRIYASITYMAS